MGNHAKVTDFYGIEQGNIFCTYNNVDSFREDSSVVLIKGKKRPLLLRAIMGIYKSGSWISDNGMDRYRSVDLGNYFRCLL